MKSLTIICLLVFLAQPVFPQLFGSKCSPEKEREFGGPAAKYTKYFGNDALLVGGYGGWHLSEKFAIGGAGYGLVSRISVPGEAVKKDTRLKFGYGGLILFYSQPLMERLDLSGTVLIGGGKFSFDNAIAGLESEDEVFVLEPSLELRVKVLDFLRVGIASTYQFVVGTDTPGLSDSKIGNFTAQINFTFGEF